ncbi:hypothetical protein [Bacillus sp. SJS]|uniref:hypothetical protein n=1 Tax=Bacillus sp. SJS TaxID=1423321 RepID=UPI0004DD8EC1|nr:hypothetical protein [Bacillus sp. SJS]KZZ86236.1 hypothetical protein AS29_001280 [Bacillus sp. SJS]
MHYFNPNANLNTKIEIVAELKNELNNMLGDIRCDRMICSDSEYPVRYEVDRAIAFYAASLIYRFTGEEEYNWKENNSSEITELDLEVNEHRIQQWSQLEKQ